MEEAKSFQGKTLDEAIRKACDYFDTVRSRLEIDIIEDAKTGLFGIVGARQATIKAKLVSDRSDSVLLGQQGLSLKLNDDEAGAKGGEPAAPARKPRQHKNTAPAIPVSAAPAAQPAEVKAETQTVQQPESAESPAPAQEQKPTNSGRRGHRQERQTRRNEGARERRSNREPSVASVCSQDTDGSEPHTPFAELDKAALEEITREAAVKLVESILGEVPINVVVSESSVTVSVECGEQTGTLVGRDGQTLSSLEYLLSRIVSTRMCALVHVRVNPGDYRERQDDRLRELAFVLAERVRSTGRACSTRPLTAYHRRIIHVALQDVEDVQTRSSGEGTMKRVIVQKRKVQPEAAEGGQPSAE